MLGPWCSGQVVALPEAVGETIPVWDFCVLWSGQSISTPSKGFPAVMAPAAHRPNVGSGFDNPHDVAIGGNGRLYVVDLCNISTLAPSGRGRGAVVRHGNFSRAASELEITPAAVSQRVRALEAQIGVQLFRRSGPKLAGL